LQANDAAWVKEKAMKTNTAPKSNAAALNAFIGKKAQIDAMIAQLQALSENHFASAPGSVNWADVGSLEFIEGKLREIKEFADV
jgi:hypothetical protein